MNQTDNVVELLLNFAALEFVSYLDNGACFLSSVGLFGTKNQIRAKEIAEKKIHGQNTTSKVSQIIMALTVAVMIGGWGCISLRQLRGFYNCQKVVVQFDDDFLPALGTFSGIYEQKKVDNFRSTLFSTSRIQYVNDETNTRAWFGYCDSITAWTFTFLNNEKGIDTELNACDLWYARSSETKTYDLLETKSLVWVVREDNNDSITADLNHLHLACLDCENDKVDACGGNISRGTCHNNACKCAGEAWYGLSCEFEKPWETLRMDERYSVFAVGPRDWSVDYELLKDANDEVVDVYHRPVYVSKNQNKQLDIILFTGRRWIATYSDAIFEDDFYNHSNIFRTASDIKSKLSHYFLTNKFHGNWYYNSSSFISEPMDIQTPADAATPIGLAWYAKQRSSGGSKRFALQPPDLSRPLDARFLSNLCNDENNPCNYNGKCKNQTCECDYSSSGSLCQIPPKGNGHCDRYFNTPEFEYDGGDCCKLSCKKDAEYKCGLTKDGTGSVGFPFCVDDAYNSTKWKADKFLSFSPRSNDWVTDFLFSTDGEQLIIVEEVDPSIRVRILEWDGTEWVDIITPLTDIFINDDYSSVYNGRLAMSKGYKHFVTNKFNFEPRLIAVAAEAWDDEDDADWRIKVFYCEKASCSPRGNEIAVVNGTRIEGLQVSYIGDIVGFVSYGNELPPVRGSGKLLLYRNDGNTWISLSVMANNEDYPIGLLMSRDGFVVSVVFGTAPYYRDSENIVSYYVQSFTMDWVNSSYVYIPRGREIAMFDLIDYDFDGYLSPSNAVAMSADGNVFAVSKINEFDITSVDVYVWNDTDWVRRGPSFGKRKLHVATEPIVTLSDDGLIAVITDKPQNNQNGWDDDWDYTAEVLVYEWDGTNWNYFGLNLSFPFDSMKLSGDCSTLGFVGIDGGVFVYNRVPPTQECSHNESLLRVSSAFAGDYSSLGYWQIQSNTTGETILFDELRLDDELSIYAFEKCVATDDCFIFSTENDDENVHLFWEGKTDEITFADDGWLADKYIGNCSQSACPDGTQYFVVYVYVYTDTPCAVTWELQKEKRIDSDTGSTIYYNETISKGNNFNDRMRNGNDVLFPTHHFCLAMEECASIVYSRNIDENFANVCDDDPEVVQDVIIDGAVASNFSDFFLLSVENSTVVVDLNPNCTFKKKVVFQSLIIFAAHYYGIVTL